MPARLVALDHKQTILVDKPILLIGRHPECDIQLESAKVSRRHCCLAYGEAHLLVRDLESTNGTRINGKRILEGRVKHGDELTLGNVRFRVTWDDPQSGAIEAERDLRLNDPEPVPAIPMEAPHLVSCEFPMPLPEPPAAQVREPGDSKVGTERE